jgi:hypothetical protein
MKPTHTATQLARLPSGGYSGTLTRQVEAKRPQDALTTLLHVSAHYDRFRSEIPCWAQPNGWIGLRVRVQTMVQSLDY